jgi:superfamily II DNA or RNA helicase
MLITRKPRVAVHDYQLPHAEKLAEIVLAHGAAADLSDTGTGKTYCALHVAKMLDHKAFIIGPKSAAEKWMHIAVDMLAPFMFSGGWEEARGKNFRYNLFRSEGGKFTGGKRVCEWRLPPRTLLVYDEAHRGKNRSTLNSIMLAGSIGVPTLILSATLAAEVKHMYASGLVLGLHQGHDFTEFVRLHAGDPGSLHRALFPAHAARMRVADIPGFPTSLVVPELVKIEHPEKLSAWRQEVIAREAELKRSGKGMQAITARLRFRQAAEIEKLPAILEKIGDAVEEGSSVVVFLNFRETLFQAMKVLQNHAVCLYGEQKPGEAKAAVEAFQANRKHVILVTHGSGSESVSLHDLHGRARVSVISPPESATALRQALGRIRRDGAKTHSIQYIFFAAGVEEDVYRQVSGKAADIGTINDGDLA